MPRVTNPPRLNHVSTASPHRQGPLQSPLKIPLNDDRQEKAVRLQSRQALHDLQLNTLKAAASPVRKLNNYNRAASDSPQTPRSRALRVKEDDEAGSLAVIVASAMTPMKRVPILANFEEWMKMATDNKINAANSWNFALIDYFHDMSLLKEGDGVNFQKASCTLDGCVKIYTSRVDSVATETGKLLSGLADSGNRKPKRGEGGAEADDRVDREDEEGEDGNKKKAKKRTQRSSEATLAPYFTSIQLKKFELEFSVDPLFKKASADFDEGGAKGLLLNHLAIDSTGRIVFDSSDDAEDASAEGNTARRQCGAVSRAGENRSLESLDQEQTDKCGKTQPLDIDIGSLGLKFFPDLTRLDEQDICPSLKNLDLGNSVGSLDIPLLKAPEEWRQETDSPVRGDLGDQTGIFLDGDNIVGFEDDDGDLGGFDLAADAGFGEGGDVWAKNAVIEPQTLKRNFGFEEGAIGEGQGAGGVESCAFDPDSNHHTISLYHKEPGGRNEDILNYFDNALQKHWAGPEHWRIRRIKDTNRAPAPVPLKRKEKVPTEIDFMSPLTPSLAEMIYTPAASNSTISLSKSQWKSKTRNLLPDDKHFNSRQLLRLFLKPKARMGSRRQGFASQRQIARQEDIPENEMDEAFWARKENNAAHVSKDEEAPQGDYDANFFQDDGVGLNNGPVDDDEEFADAREVMSLNLEHNLVVGRQGMEGSQEGAFGTQLVTQNRRLRPEYVQYARVAKKVDVRRLKEEMWRGIGFKENMVASQAIASPSPSEEIDKSPLKFTTVINNLQLVYPKQAMADISTSYCFICLLHLANEKGLTLDNDPGLGELSIRRDYTAEITEGDA